MGASRSKAMKGLPPAWRTARTTRAASSGRMVEQPTPPPGCILMAGRLLAKPFLKFHFAGIFSSSLGSVAPARSSLARAEAKATVADMGIPPLQIVPSAGAGKDAAPRPASQRVAAGTPARV